MPALRASTVPPCISTRLFTSVRPMPNPLVERSSERIDLHEHVEDVSKLIGGDADAAVAHPDDGLLAFALDGEPNATALVGELAGVVQRLPTT